jgi:hypothetical protein
LGKPPFIKAAAAAEEDEQHNANNKITRADILTLDKYFFG